MNDFNAWFDRLILLDPKGVIKPKDKDSYKEYFEDGDTPEIVLQIETKRSKECGIA